MLAQITIGEAASSDTILSPHEIAAILSIYTPDYRYIAQAELKNVEIRCKFRKALYPYTTDQIFDYLTAPTLTVFVCQMVYVLIGGLSLARHPSVDLIGGWENFQKLRDKALLRIGSLTTRIREEIRNEAPIDASMEMDGYHMFKSVAHCRFRYDIGGCVSGRVHGVLMRG
jgi:hypothetical protein